MKSQDSQSRWTTKLGVSISATLLASGLGANAANASDGATPFAIPNIVPNIRDTARAERHQQRLERQDARVQTRLDNQAAVLNSLSNSANSFATAGTIGVSNQRREARMNTAIIYPGQVSEFRTTRPSNRSTYTNDAGNEKILRKGVSLDLSSTASKITVGANLFDGSVTISVGGEQKTVSAGDKVTAAEYAALTQKLATGDQGLVLSDKGAATGGALSLNTVSDDGKTIRASELVIPENVSVSGDFARNADGVRVTGDLSNAGSIYAVSTNAAKNNAVIGARDINNAQSGVITTDVPDSVSAQYGSTNSALNLSLRANRDFSNDGSITSSGDVELTAGRNLSNSGLVQANGNVNLNSSNISNSGTITSNNQNVAISAPTDSSIVFNGTGGSVNAINGDINFATVSNLNQKLDTTIIGGDWYSNNLNINSSDGHVLGMVGDVSGLVNIKAGIGHFGADTDNLKLGQMDFTGDPLFYNTGDLDIGALSLTTSGAPLALVAGGDVFASASTSINTSNGVTGGGNLTIVAGAAFGVDGFGAVNIIGPSVTGGSIDLTNVSSVDTSGLNFAGNVFMSAWAGTGGSSGTIYVPSTITTGSASNVNGNITIIAPSLINIVGTIQPTSGFVSIVGATPTLQGQFILNPDGSHSGTFPTAGALTSTPISLGTTTFLGGASIRTAADISLNSLTSNGGTVVVEGRNITSSSINATTAVNLLAHATLNLAGNINGAGGFLGMASGTIVLLGNYAISANSATGPGGSVSLIAGVNFTNDGTSVTTLGASTNGGNVNLSTFSTLQGLSSVTSANNSRGGDITLVAYSGSGNNGRVLIPTSVTILTGSSGASGTPGNITLIGGATSGNAVYVGDISTASSTTSSGGALGVAVGNPLNPVTINLTTQQTNTSFNNVMQTDGNVQLGNITMLANSQTHISSQNGSMIIGTINTANSVGIGTGSAGSVEIVVSGSGNLTTGNIVTAGLGATSGGDVTISMQSGTLTTPNINADAGTSGHGGAVEISVNRNTQLLTNGVTANSSSGAGGSITIKNFGSGGIALANGLYNANGSTDGGTIIVDAAAGAIDGSITTAAGLTINVASGAGFQAGSVSLLASNISIGGNFGIQTTGGTGGLVNLATSNGNIDVDGAVLINAGGDVSISTTNGTLRTNAASAVHTVTINAAGDITTNAINTNGLAGGQNGGAVVLNSAGGLVSTGIINTSGNGTGTAGNVTLTADSDITAAAITATGSNTPLVTLHTTGAGEISIPGVINATNLLINIEDEDGSATLVGNNLVTNISTLGSGDVFFDNGIALNIGTIQSDIFAASSPVSVTFTTSFTSTGGVTVETPVVTFNNVTLNVATFIAQNTTGDLTVNGGSSTITASTPPAGAPGFPSDPAAISFITATGADLDLFGTLAFNGDVLLYNPEGTTTSHTNSQFIGTNNVTLTTDTWLQQTNGNITGNKFIFTGYTIANKTGDVTLNQDILFTGRSVAIIAFGNINLGTHNINLSNPTGDSGSLLMLAGVSFDNPPPGTQLGQFQSQGLFDNVTFNTVTGGSITGSGNITLTGGGSNGNGGKLLAVANLGLINFTGNINTSSAAANGGSVGMIAPNGITTGNITTTGGTNGLGGDVTLEVVNAAFTPSSAQIQVSAGLLSGGTVSEVFPPLDAPIFVNGSVLSGNGNVLLGTLGNVRVANNLTGHNILVVTGDNRTLTFDTINTLSANVDAFGNGGSIFIATADVVNPTGTFAFNVNGTTGDAGDFRYATSANNLTVGTGGDITVSATGAGDGASIEFQTPNNLTIGAGGLNLAHSRGDGAIIDFNVAADGTGTLTLNDTSFFSEANAKGVPGDNFDGGRITLRTQQIAYQSSSTAPLTLSANGLGLGNGGTVQYITNDTAPTYFGLIKKNPKGPANFLRISATSGSLGGNAGIINVQTGSNITVGDTSLIDAHTNSTTLANGAVITLTAGNLEGKQGFLVIQGDLDASAVGGGTGGQIVLLSDNKKDFVVNNGRRVPKNGISGTLTADGASGRISVENLGGGVEIATQAAVDANTLEIHVNEKGTIKTGKDVVLTAQSLYLSSEFGAIGKKPLNVNAQFLTLNSSGSSVNVNNLFAGNTTLFFGSDAAEDFTLTTAGGLTVQDTTARNGDLSLTAGGGTLTIAGHVQAINGGIVINNTNATTGDILIDDNSIVETSGKKGDDVIIAIGAVPKKGTNTTDIPLGISVDPQGTRGKAYFGPVGGVVATGSAVVNVINKDVIFNNASTGINKITVGNNVVITADPPSPSGANLRGASALMFGDVLTTAPQTVAPSVMTPTQPGVGTPSTPDVTLNLAMMNNANALTVSSESQVNGAYGSLNTIGNVPIATGDGGVISATVGSDTTKVVSLKQGTVRSDNGESGFSAGDLIVDAELHNGGTESAHHLQSDKAIFAPTNDTVVETAHGSVKVAAGSVALITQSNSGLAVYNLHDNHKNSVVISVNGSNISLPPGRHAHISTQRKGVFADVNPIELVQHRDLQQSKLANGMRVYTSEFAIPSACYAVKSLKQLMTSSDVASKRIAKQIMKTSSVIMTLSPDRGDYVQHFNPRMTASR